MYTIPIPSKAILENHVRSLKGDIQTLVKKYHPAYTGATIKSVVATQTLTLDIKVEEGSLTKWFLDWLLVDKNLDTLLRGQMTELLDIIQLIETTRADMGVDERLVYKKITAKTYKAVWKDWKTKSKGVTFLAEKDVFNAVIYQIFVTEGFEGDKKNVEGKKAPFFDKTSHVDGCKLRICPYCGRAFIYAIDGDSGTVMPQIDHFLPKRKYPYLALSYFNLIPVCSTCNMSACKGDYDPMITLGKRPFSISYPYDFKDSDYEFVMGIYSSNYFDDANFNVAIDFKNNRDLERGSYKALKLSEFYKFHNHEAASIYRQLMILKSRAKFYYSSFNLPKAAFYPSPNLILGFPFDEASSRKEILYKLKKDVFKQLLAYYGCP